MEDAGVAVPVLSPLRVCFQHVIQQSERLSKLGVLDEETLTSCLLGGLAASLPFVAHLRSTGASADVSRCFWGPYRKSGSKDRLRTESGSGADFALLLAEGPSSMRLAIFQAKKGKKRRRPADQLGTHRWELDVHRRPPKAKDGVQREAQMIRLARTGRALSDAAASGQGCPPIDSSDNDAVKPEQSLPIVGDLHWIHYLAYTDKSPSCLALSGLEEALAREETNSGTKNYVAITGSQPFFDLLLRGLEPTTTIGWLSINLDIAKTCLPYLVGIVPLFVGDSSGSVAAELGLDDDFAAAPATSSEMTLEALSARLAVANDRAPKPAKLKT